MYNPYQFANPYYVPNNRIQNSEQFQPQFSQPQPQSYPQNPQSYPQPIAGLQGKSVDNVDVVKATDIPLDGSISYFPITDGSAIVTKQLQNDGTSKMVIYKPVTPEQVKEELPKYVTVTEVEEMLKQEPKDVKDLKEEIKNLKRQIRDLTDDIKDCKRKD